MRRKLYPAVLTATFLVLGMAMSADRVNAQQGNAAGPGASMPPHCVILQRKGFTITQSSYSKSVTLPATSPTQPRPGSFPAPVGYGQKGNNQWFIDSFLGVPKSGCRVCGVTVAVAGTIGGANDGFGVIGANDSSPQFQGTPLAANPVHTRLVSAPQLPLGPFNHTLVIDGPTYMNWYLASSAPTLDIYMQDDSMINSIQVTYFVY